MQGSDRVHCLPRGRLVTPSGASGGFFGAKPTTRSDLRTARRATNLSRQVQRYFAAGRHIDGKTSANSKGTQWPHREEHNLRILAPMSSVALLIIANAPIRAHTAEERERSYRFEAMERFRRSSTLTFMACTSTATWRRFSRSRNRHELPAC